METDMRDFALAEHFSLVFIARNSLLHLHTHDDFVRCFRCIHRHLDQGGLLAIDIFNPAISILASSPEERQPVARVMHPDKGWVSVEAISDYDSRTQVNRATWFASSESAPDYLVAPLHLRCVFSEERVLLLEMVGFTLEARFGDFERSPFDSSSARQICLCRAA
jgi:SAM-dependent methyltransferase